MVLQSSAEPSRRTHRLACPLASDAGRASGSARRARETFRPRSAAVLTLLPFVPGVLSTPADVQAAPLYWDSNGSAPGSPVVSLGTWGTSNFWSTSPDGIVATGAWIAGSNAVFCAGTNALNTAVTVSGTQSVGGFNFEEGNCLLTGGTLSLTAPGIDVASGLTATIESAVTGSTGVNKTGAGTALLRGTNSFSGTLTVSAGVLECSSLSAGQPTVVQSGASLQLAGATVSRPLQISGTGVAGKRALGGAGTWSEGITLASNTSVGGPNGNLVLSGPIGGAFALTKTGLSTIELTNAGNSFTALNISAGTVAMSSQSPIPSAAPITVASGGVLHLKPVVDTVFSRILNLNGGLLASEGPNDTWATPINCSSNGNMIASQNRLTLTGSLSGAVGVSKGGVGDLVLAADNSGFSGQWLVNSGTLTVQSSAGLGPSSVIVYAGATLQFKSNATHAAGLSIEGHGTSGQGALFNAQGSNTISYVGLAAPTSIGVAAGSTLTVTQVYDSPFQDDPPQTLVKNGLGTLLLPQANTYHGDTIVNGGILSINSDASLGMGKRVTTNLGAKVLVTATTSTARNFTLNSGSIQVNSGTTLTYSGATIEGGSLRGPGTHLFTGSTILAGVTNLPGSNILQNGTTWINNFTNGGTFTSNSASGWEGGFNTASGQFIVNSPIFFTQGFENNGTITVNNAATLSNRFNNLVSGGGSMVNINTGGTLQLNTFTFDLRGALAVNNGTIAGGTTNVYFGSLLAGTGSFGAVVLHPGGAFTRGVTLANMPAPGPAGNALITPLDPNQSNASPILLAAHATATVDAADNTLTLSGPVTGTNITLTKTGGGTLTLSGDNTYTGGTTVQAGTLQVKRMHENNAVDITGGTLRVLESAPTLSSGLPSGNNASVSRPSSLTVAPGATLDLTNNDLILDYSGASPVAAYEALVASAYNVGVGDWSGTGITSSVAALDGNYVLAIADNAALAAPFGTANGGPLFAGVEVDLTTILVKFTHRADVDLDGVVTPNDAAIFGGNYSENDPAVWSTGDMDYDGIYTPTDAAIFGGFYDESLASLPEPAALRLLGLAVAAGMLRRRAGRESCRPCRLAQTTSL